MPAAEREKVLAIVEEATVAIDDLHERVSQKGISSLMAEVGFEDLRLEWLSAFRIRLNAKGGPSLATFWFLLLARYEAEAVSLDESRPPGTLPLRFQDMTHIQRRELVEANIPNEVIELGIIPQIDHETWVQLDHGETEETSETTRSSQQPKHQVVKEIIINNELFTSAEIMDFERCRHEMSDSKGFEESLIDMPFGGVEQTQARARRDKLFRYFTHKDMQLVQERDAVRELQNRMKTSDSTFGMHVGGDRFETTVMERMKTDEEHRSKARDQILQQIIPISTWPVSMLLDCIGGIRDEWRDFSKLSCAKSFLIKLLHRALELIANSGTEDSHDLGEFCTCVEPETETDSNNIDLSNAAQRPSRQVVDLVLQDKWIDDRIGRVFSGEVWVANMLLVTDLESFFWDAFMQLQMLKQVYQTDQDTSPPSWLLEAIRHRVYGEVGRAGNKAAMAQIDPQFHGFRSDLHVAPGEMERYVRNERGVSASTRVEPRSVVSLYRPFVFGTSVPCSVANVAKEDWYCAVLPMVARRFPQIRHRLRAEFLFQTFDWLRIELEERGILKESDQMRLVSIGAELYIMDLSNRTIIQGKTIFETIVQFLRLVVPDAIPTEEEHAQSIEAEKIAGTSTTVVNGVEVVSRKRKGVQFCV